MTSSSGHAIVRSALLWVSRRPAIGRAATSLPVSRGLVRRFVAGQALDDALRVVADLRASGFRTTVDVLGETTADTATAESAADAYVRLLGALKKGGLEPNVSLKLTHLGLDADPALCSANVEEVARAATRLGGFVRIDMEDHTRVRPALELGSRLRALGLSVGVVVQAYLRRSAVDVDRLIASNVPVRLCKGAYAEPADIAYIRKRDVDASYAALAEELLIRGPYPAFATHDQSLIERVIAFAEANAITPSRFEFQMLYGIRRDLQGDLIRAGYTVRVYVPFGPDWFPYFMRRLAERPANAVFVVRSILREGRHPSVSILSRASAQPTMPSRGRHLL